MVITLLSTEQREQMKNDFLCDVVDCLHRNTNAYHCLSHNDFAMTVEKYFITPVESSDRLWEEGKIRCTFEYNSKQVEHTFVGKLLVNAVDRDALIREAFDKMYSRLINIVLVSNEAKEYYDELDY
jgi:hypothetical protein